MYSALYFRNMKPWFNFTDDFTVSLESYEKYSDLLYFYRFEVLLFLNLVFMLFRNTEKNDTISERIVHLLSNGRPRKTKSIIRNLNLDFERREFKRLYLIPLKRNGILNYHNHVWSV